MARMKIKRNDEELDILLFDAYDEFIAIKEVRNLSKATLRNYDISFNYFCNFYEFNRDTPLNEIKSQHIYKWMNTLKNQGIKPLSINTYISNMRSFFYWCMAEERQYMPHFKIELMKYQEETLKMFSDEDIEKLLIKPRRSDSFVEWRTWVIVNWVLATGNRASTILNVKLSDINFTKKEIALAHTKNKKAQIIPMSSELDKVVREYVKMWRSEAAVDAYLFPSISDEKMNYTTLQSAFTKYCEKREVSRHNIHGLRHNFAKGFIMSNGNIFVLQKILGHQTLEMTRRYIKIFGEDLKEEYDSHSPLDTIKKNQKREQKIKRNLG